MAEHTPTPWSYDYVKNEIRDANGNRVTWLDDHMLEATKRKMVDRVNAFHSEDGREIPTEAITPGLVWRLIDALEGLIEFEPPALFHSETAEVDDQDHIQLRHGATIRHARALLSKLEPQR